MPSNVNSDVEQPNVQMNNDVLTQEMVDQERDPSDNAIQAEMPDNRSHFDEEDDEGYGADQNWLGEDFVQDTAMDG